MLVVLPIANYSSREPHCPPASVLGLFNLTGLEKALTNEEGLKEGVMNLFLAWMSTCRSWDGSYDAKESFLATKANMSLRVLRGEILENKSKRIQIKPKSLEALVVIGWVHRHFWMRLELKNAAMSIRLKSTHAWKDLSVTGLRISSFTVHLKALLLDLALSSCINSLILWPYIRPI